MKRRAVLWKLLMINLLVLAIGWPFSAAANTPALPARAATGQSPSGRPPNILWILVEDMAPFLGCYGNAANAEATPHLDWIAAHGTLFERAFATAPVCSASRSALIVGAMQTTTGTHHHRTARWTPRDGRAPENLRPLPAPFVPLPQLLVQAGWHTFNHSKDDYNFTYRREDLYLSGNRPNADPYPANPWQGHWGGGSWADRARPDQPWFGQWGLQGGKNSLKQLPDDQKIAPEALPLQPWFPDEPVFRRLNSWHHNTVRQTDREVGELLEQLRAAGELDQTVVFFFSDHGDDRDLRAKQFCYEAGLHIPLLVMGPGIPKGERREELVSLLDVTASTLALAGQPLPEWLEGRPLFGGQAGTAREFVIGARDRCDYAIDRIRTVRTENFRYIRNFLTDRPLLQPQYRDRRPEFQRLVELDQRGELPPGLAQSYFLPRAAEELYDLRVDAAQLRNLAADPEFADELARHRQILDQWMAETGDQGQFPESDAELRAQIGAWGEACVNPEYDRVRAVETR